MKALSHYDKAGRVQMVDVTAKPATSRTAVAHAFVRMKRATVANLRRLKSPKGDPLEIARIAGITAAKRTSELIPLCHPLALTHVDVQRKAMPEWNRDYIGGDGHGAYGRGNGSAGGRVGGGPDDLRYVQSPRTRDGDHRVVPGEEIRRAQRNVRSRRIIKRASRKERKVMAPTNDVKVLVVDDNALVLDLLMKGLGPHCDAHSPRRMAPTRCSRSSMILRT